MLVALRSGFKRISNILEEGKDENGGYLVPEEWDSRLIDKLTEENIFLSLATTITTSGEHKIYIAATKPAAAWIEEGQALSFGEATFDQVVLDDVAFQIEGIVVEQLFSDFNRYMKLMGIEHHLIKGRLTHG